MSRVFVAHPGDLIIFWDDRFPPEDGNVNRVGVIVDGGGALFIGKSPFGWRRIERIRLQHIPSLANLTMRRTDRDGMGEKIAAYFSACRSPSLFKAGLLALLNENHQPFEMGKLFPTRPNFHTNADYERAWDRLARFLLPGDVIFTLDSEHPVSRFIAWATHGPWSHVATYEGEGQIWESVTSGIRRAPLTIYKGRRYWVAAYRHIGAFKRPITREIMAAVTAKRDEVFRPGYNYKMALYHGLRAFFHDHDRALVPNSTIYSGLFVLIAQA